MNRMREEDYKRDCFAFKQSGGGKAVCIALTCIDCVGCSFYKTKEQFKEDVKKCELHNQKTGSAERYKGAGIGWLLWD